MEMNRGKKVVYLESLGCNKNTVDSEIILSLLNQAGYKLTRNPGEASDIIVNTCAFIDDAKEESIDTILELARCKKRGTRLIVSGCLPQLYSREILENIPEVDAVTGVGDISAVLHAVKRTNTLKDYPLSRNLNGEYREYQPRTLLLTSPGSAYLKISEGCSRNCSFCLIPQIKGKMRSRRPYQIVEEAKMLEKKGISELIVISQDTIRYGDDLHLAGGLRSLMEKLLRETEIRMYRLLYLRPGGRLVENLDIFSHGRVAPYLDIPVQHVSKNILQRMNREGDYEMYMDVVRTIRARVPGAVLRTTLIVGFPGEEGSEFDLLMKFVREAEFDHLGVFTYSPQKGTNSYRMQGAVPKETAEQRKMKVLAAQRLVSRSRLMNNIGKVFDVLIEERVEGEKFYFGRSYHFAPEVDGVFVVRSDKRLNPGSIVQALVTSSDDYDLHGRLISS
jgi:ribosomal protein S12 methylthiotransferase